MTELISAIMVGQYDADLSAIREAIRMREGTLVQASALGIKAGDTVAFNDQANPKYLKGIKAVVVKKNPKSVVVNIEENFLARKFSGSRNVRCPLAIVEVVNA